MRIIHSAQAPAAIGPYVQAYEHQGVVYTSGQIPIDPLTGNLAGSDITSQTKQVMENLKAVLTAAGTDFSKVIKTTCFLSDLGNFQAFNETYGSYFESTYPARSCVEVARLPRDVLVEIEVVASRGE